MFKNITKANNNLKGFIVRTPTRLSNAISELVKKNIYIKYENFQHTGSFKYRGALNKILSLDPIKRKKGVIAMSAGNHAQGLSLACKLLKLKAVIVMPNNTPFEKIRTSDIIFICTPVSIIDSIATQIFPYISDRSIVSDVGSVKNCFTAKTIKLYEKKSFLLPGHPIAGTEHSGAKSARLNLFLNKWCILTPFNKKKKQVSIISNIWKRIGAKISIMSADQHDKIMSITSHLPHLIAFTIVFTAF